MRVAAAIACLILFTAPVAAEGGFFGGMADGIDQGSKRDLERRALDLDAKDGGSRYERLRLRNQIDELKADLRRNTEALERVDRDRRPRGY